VRQRTRQRVVALTRVAPLMSTPDMLILMVGVATFKGTVSVIFKRPSMKRGQCLIYNDTL